MSYIILLSDIHCAAIITKTDQDFSSSFAKDPDLMLSNSELYTEVQKLSGKLSISTNDVYPVVNYKQHYPSNEQRNIHCKYHVLKYLILQYAWYHLSFYAILTFFLLPLHHFDLVLYMLEHLLGLCDATIHHKRGAIQRHLAAM